MTSFKQKENVIYSTMLLFIDKQFTKKELNIIMTEIPENEQKRIKEEENKHTSHILKLGNDQNKVKDRTTFPETVSKTPALYEETVKNIESTGVLGGNKKSYWMVVSDSKGYIYKYSQGDKSFGSTQACDSHVNGLISHNDNIFFFCKNIIGRYIPELNKVRILHKQSTEIFR